MNEEKKLEGYLSRLEQKVGQHNTKLIQEFSKAYKSWPGEPSTRRIRMICVRLSSISQMLNNKPLDKLTEKEFQELNLVMREKKLLSAQDYRKALKMFFRLLLKPRIKNKEEKADLLELLDSDYLKAPFKKAGSTNYVNRDEFWEEEHINKYLEVAKQSSPKALAFASLIISSGCRPHELIRNITKKQVEFNGTALILRVNSGKTGKRSIVINHNEGKAVWEYVEPYWTTLNDGDKMFPQSWEACNLLHKEFCKRIKLPKEKSRKLYIFRKMALTRFYNENKYATACALAGHQPGGKAARHYIAIGEEELLGKTMARVSTKECPNCGWANSYHAEVCAKCGSPTNKDAFKKIVESITDEKVDVIAELVKEKMLAKAFQ